MAFRAGHSLPCLPSAASQASAMACCAVTDQRELLSPHPPLGREPTAKMAGTETNVVEDRNESWPAGPGIPVPALLLQEPFTPPPSIALKKQIKWNGRKVKEKINKIKYIKINTILFLSLRGNLAFDGGKKSLRNGISAEETSL